MMETLHSRAVIPDRVDLDGNRDARCCSFAFVLPPSCLLIFTACLLFSLQISGQEAALAREENVPFIEQTLQRSDDFYAGGMRTLVDDVVKITGVTGPTIEELQKVATESVADKMTKSKVGLWKTWRAMAKDGEVDQVQFWNAYRKLPEAALTPDRSPIWEEGVKRLLKPDELAKWEAEAAIRRGRVEKAISDYLNRGREQWKTQRVDARKTQAEEIIALQKLDADTAVKLREGIDPAVTKSLVHWGKGLEKSIREYVKSAFLGGADDRILALEGGQINFGNAAEPEAMAADEAAWRELLQGSLAAPAYALWESREQQRLDRRIKAMAMLTVAELDRKLRLTEEQRSRLEAMLNGVIRTAKPKIDAMLAQSYSNSEILLMVLNGIPLVDVQKLLEPDQMAGWRELAGRYSGWWNQYQ